VWAEDRLRPIDNAARSNRLLENRPENHRHGSHQATIDCFKQAPVVHTWAYKSDKDA
jgi:hypothetical protein